MTLSITSGDRGLVALIQRALRLDDACTARIAQRSSDSVECFITTPLDVVASRRAAGQGADSDCVYSASSLLMRVEGQPRLNPEPTPLSGGLLSWPGALPPVDGYELIEIIPGTVILELADEGKKLGRQFSTTMGPPVSLLDSTVLTCSSDAHTVTITMRTLFALNSLGFLPKDPAGQDDPHVVVSQRGAWNRLDTLYGSVYWNAAPSLLNLSRSGLLSG